MILRFRDGADRDASVCLGLVEFVEDAGVGILLQTEGQLYGLAASGEKEVPMKRKNFTTKSNLCSKLLEALRRGPRRSPGDRSVGWNLRASREPSGHEGLLFQ